MVALGKVLIGLAICGAVYAWIQSIPVPDGFLEPGKLRMNFAIMSVVMKMVSTVKEWFLAMVLVLVS